MVLNTLADRDTSSLYFAVKRSPVDTSTPTHSYLSGDGKYLYIAGLGDRDTREVKPKAALKNTSFPRILLTHHPDVFYEVEEQTDLMLAGHTHGGQVVLPLWGPILIPTDYPKKFAHGMVEENGNRIIVTKGIGTSILPIRFNCKPEIVVIHFI